MNSASSGSSLSRTIHAAQHLAFKTLLGLALLMSPLSVTRAQEYPPAINFNYDYRFTLYSPGSDGVWYYEVLNGSQLSLHIATNGVVSIDTQTYQASGVYDFTSGIFSIDTTSDTLPLFLTAVYSTGEQWLPLASTQSARYGPPSLWIEGSVYSWTSTTVSNDSYGAPGIDYYSDGNGHTVSFNTCAGYEVGASAIVQGVVPSGSLFNGYFFDSVFQPSGSEDARDIRAADSNGNPINSITSRPSELPPALKVGGNSSLWYYLSSSNSGFHTYVGSQPGQRLFIDPSNAVIFGYPLIDYSPAGFYGGNVVLMQAGVPTIRAVELDGTLIPPAGTPSIGPPAVWVNSTLWRYAGTSYNYFGTPYVDIYLGSNDGQQLVIDSQGKVAIINLTSTATGWYRSPSGSLPGLFLVQGVEVLPGDTDTSIYHQNDALFGPPAIWVNGITYQFISSEGLTENPSDPSAWVDRYSDGSDSWVIMSSSDVTIYAADASIIWTGTYTPWTSNPANGGVFAQGNGAYYGVEPRPSNGTGLIPPYGSPHGNHPVVVKVNGIPYRFRGSLGGENPNDYYFGEAGLGLWIDSFNNVTQNTLLGVFVGTVFVTSTEVNNDLRACYANLSPVSPGTTPQWGPAAVWVEGVPWAYLGTVSDETLQIHADYYGGPNAGQVLTIDSSYQIGGAHSGTYNNGLIISGSGDLRALDSSGLFIASGGPPSQYRPSTLRFGAQQWHFLGTSGGNDYYATDEPGQRLTIAEDGSVTYYDRPNNIASASGTYNSSDGTITAQSGGIVYDVGTNKGDLDILGNILSLGSLTGNKNSAGVTIAFRDDTSVAESPSSSLSLTLTRPNATWLWSHGTGSSTTTQAMMSLDSAHRLNLYDPAVATANPDPVVRLDPNPAGKSKLGNVSITGSIRFQPAGDIDMGIYTAGPQP